MNIYYELPETVEGEDSDNPLISRYALQARATLEEMTLKFKYRLMWELRSMEAEIDVEDGMITLRNESPNFHLKGFSAELTSKIKAKLSKINWDVW